MTPGGDKGAAVADRINFAQRPICLRDLLRGIGSVVFGARDPVIERITQFASEVRPGSLYVACETPLLRGHLAVAEAMERGAASVVLERLSNPFDPDRCPVVIVPNSKKAYSALCANYFGHPERDLRFYAVTGTSGKTTTCHLLESILKAAGARVGAISTVYRRTSDWEVSSSNTTPEPFEFYGLLRAMADDRVTDVVVEASSIGLAEQRLFGLHMEGVAFTNLGLDHIGYHGGLLQYKEAKASLFRDFKSAERPRKVCAVNVDDPFGLELCRPEFGDLAPYSLSLAQPRDVRIKDALSRIGGDISGVRFESSFFGVHNAANILAAAALALGLGISADAIAQGIAHLRSIPGRLESVGATAYVDYAHTAESVRAALTALRGHSKGKAIIAVLGCGGGGDKDKRSNMARAALDIADVTIFTTDNPRWEEPNQIIKDMLAAKDTDALKDETKLEVQPDRREAIHRAVAIARGRNAIVAVLGKGHETFQEIKGIRLPFSDQQILYGALSQYPTPAVSVDNPL